MPVMPPRVSTSSTRNSRFAPKAWPLSHGELGHGMRSMVMRTAVMVVSVMYDARFAGAQNDAQLKCCAKIYRASMVPFGGNCYRRFEVPVMVSCGGGSVGSVARCVD